MLCQIGGEHLLVQSVPDARTAQGCSKLLVLEKLSGSRRPAIELLLHVCRKCPPRTALVLPQRTSNEIRYILIQTCPYFLDRTLVIFHRGLIERAQQAASKILVQVAPRYVHFVPVLKGAGKSRIGQERGHFSGQAIRPIQSFPGTSGCIMAGLVCLGQVLRTSGCLMVGL